MLLLVCLSLVSVVCSTDQIAFYVVCDNQILPKPLVNVIIEPNQPKYLIKDKTSKPDGLQMLKSELDRPLYTIELSCSSNETKKQKHWIQSPVSKSSITECLHTSPLTINFDVLWMTKAVFSGYIACKTAQKRFLEVEGDVPDKPKVELKEDGKFEIRFKKQLQKEISIKVGCDASAKVKSQIYTLDWPNYSKEHLLFNEVLVLSGDTENSLDYVDKSKV
uniref:Uncharacterized protein n=1 Tax=Ditylenchus dipsaci TaxID=166011 RepID=A0A915D2T5_9BILA